MKKITILLISLRSILSHAFFAIFFLSACQKETTCVADDFSKEKPQAKIIAIEGDQVPVYSREIDTEWPPCSTELANTVAQLQALANASCQTQYGWLHCTDENGAPLHYSLCVVPNAANCAEFAIDESNNMQE